MKELILKSYMSLFGLIVNRPSDSQRVERLIHAHLASMVSTGVLMWSYAFVAYFTISSPIPGIVGFVASTVHLLSPLLYKKTTNHLFNTSVLLASGIVHQMTFAFFTGGFDSNILIWLGILPMLAGVMAGRRGAILWAAITTICITIFMFLKLSGFHFPDLISPQGRVIAQSLILFGWVFISSSVIWVHVLLEEKAAQRLEASRGRTQNLLNIFSHDISTPLTVISGRLAYLLKSPLDEGQMNSVSKAYKASQHLNEITTNLRELRLNELGRIEVRYSKVDVREMILELKDTFIDKLEQKSLKLNWSVASEIYDFHTSRSLILNQILGNLLSNAIKFSEQGSEIRLRVSKVDGSIQIILEDNGVGIPKDMRDHVFEANLSRSCPGTSGETGTGFGLPIVKGCIDRLNGKISFTTRTANEGPSGTTFKLIFPATKTAL